MYPRVRWRATTPEARGCGVRRECGRLFDAVRRSSAVEVCGWCALVASLAAERTSLKLAVDAAAHRVSHEVFLAIPYIALQALGLLAGTMTVGAFRCLVETVAWLWRSDQPKDAGHLMALDGANAFPRTQLAAAAAMDVLQVGLVLSTARSVPATHVVLLAHAAVPFEHLPWAWDDDAPPTPTRRPYARAATLVAIAAALLVFFPPLGAAALSLSLGRRDRALAHLRCLSVSVVYAAASIPAHLSTVYKERALEAHASPVSYAHLNLALAAWQFAVVMLCLAPTYLVTAAAYRADGDDDLASALPDAWLAVFEPRHASSTLFLVHFAAGASARLVPAAAAHLSSAPTGRRLLVIDAAVAASVPFAVVLLVILVDRDRPPLLLAADLLATLCVVAELLLQGNRPTRQFRTDIRRTKDAYHPLAPLPDSP